MHTQYWQTCKFLRYVRRIQFHTHFRLYYFLYIRLKKNTKEKQGNDITIFNSYKLLKTYKEYVMNENNKIEHSNKTKNNKS